jgi:hypothetical protein
MISSFALFISAFLALIAGINAQNSNPMWTPLYPGAPSPNGSSTNLDSRLFRGGSTTVYDPNSNRIILFGGYLANAGMKNLRLNDVWILTNANGLGTTPCPSNLASTAPCWSNLIANDPSGSPLIPHIRYRHSAVYDRATNRMIIYGGCTAGCTPIADTDNNGVNKGVVWVLSHANGMGGTPTWTQLFPTSGPDGPPPLRQGHQAVYDPITKSMIVWAGTDGVAECGKSAYSDVWVLSNANSLPPGPTPNWTKLSPMLSTGAPPPGRFLSTAVYDSLKNIMIVFGGAGNVGTSQCQSTNAVWALSNANGTGGTPTWTNLVPQGPQGPIGSPANREQHVAVYAPSHNTMTIFGGLFAVHSSGHTPTLWGDTWELSNANGLSGPTSMWTLLDPGNDPGKAVGPDPSARWNGGAIDTVNHLMIMFGGSSKEGPLWSTWKLSHPNGL